MHPKTAWLAWRELGPRQVSLYGLYALGSRFGLWRLLTPCRKAASLATPIQKLLHPPSPADLRAVMGIATEQCLTEAGEILQGKARLFGGEAVALNLAPEGSQRHWTIVRPAGDIKQVWEPARMGWAFRLGEAYAITGDERYPQMFWGLASRFWQGNPPNCGLNWASGQEVALRILAMAFAASVFPLTEEQQNQLAGAVADHARRIPPTMLYARAQHNNHLLSEAAGLYTAGCLLPELAEARRWRSTGWTWLNRGLQAQIDSDGTYAQHSLNYHRLMLHLALWCDLVSRQVGDHWPAETLQRLSAAARWLQAQVDPISGDAPNLGNNDGACILPLGAAAFRDFRPVVQAASLAFCGQPALPPGPWDALSLWLGVSREKGTPSRMPVDSPAVHRLGGETEWATLRAVCFHSRPSHADQLHVELWRRGENILRDPGTDSYNDPASHDNRLAITAVHNTLMVDGQNQMLRAGRFLWLDWAQARLVTESCQPGVRWTTEHDGYRRLGAIHRRTLELLEPGSWQVLDEVKPVGDGSAQHQVTLHWLLADGDFQLTGTNLRLRTSGSMVQLRVELPADCTPLVQLVRAGQVLAGPPEVNEPFGWYCPTYSVRRPALSLRVSIAGRLPLRMVTLIHLQDA